MFNGMIKGIVRENPHFPKTKLIDETVLDDFVKWAIKNKTVEELTVSLTEEALYLYSLLNDFSMKDSNVVVIEEVKHQTTEVEAPLKDSVQYDDDDVMYPHRYPYSTHGPMPVSLFGLPIFTAQKVGNSLENIPKESFEKLVEHLNLKITKPTIMGVTLNPVLDARILRTVLNKLVKFKESDFSSRQQVVFSYADLMEEIHGEMPSDVKAHFNRKTEVEKVWKACSRIFSLGISYEEDNSNTLKMKHFWKEFSLDKEKKEITVIPTKVIYDLFKNDRVLTLNHRLLNMPSSKIESTLIQFISGLKHEFNPKSNNSGTKELPLKVIDPIDMDVLLYRIYPNDIDVSKSLLASRSKSIVNAMNNLKANGLLDFVYTKGAKARRARYSNIINFCNLRDPKFEELTQAKTEEEVISSADSKNKMSVIEFYLSKHPIPMLLAKKKEVNQTAVINYVDKHFPVLVDLVSNQSSEQLLDSFKGVKKRFIDKLIMFSQKTGSTDMEIILCNVLDYRKQIRDETKRRKTERETLRLK
ncbi:hypothetical protein [Aliivibrio fischeri]|uniref:hypothetical protein n=1 Tax=Aliivibrio fischeri TaxID=668 RepID=UPI0007C58B23|nr:hypothetical protein [Aliivibrio fischeri]